MTTTVISPPDTSALPNDQAAAVDHAYRRLQALNQQIGSHFEIRYEERYLSDGWCIGKTINGEFFPLCNPIKGIWLVSILPMVMDAFVVGVLAGSDGHVR